MHLGEAANGRDGLRMALAWLGHPVSLVGIAVLLLNDHVLKAEYGTWWTGKLSDVAGLVFAPALLAVVVAALGGHRARPRLVAAASLAIVGVGFVWVKGTVGGAAAASAAWTAIAGPSVVRHDATDLLALPALALAWLAYRQAARRPDATRHQPGPRTVTHARTVGRVRALILVPLATLAVAATSFDDGSYEMPMAWEVYITQDTVAVLVYGEDGDYGDDWPTWWTRPVETLTTTDMPWQESSLSYDGSSSDLFGPGVTSSGSVCLPDHRLTCFRWATASPDIEESVDGGATWALAWGLTDTQHLRLEEWMGHYSGIVSDDTGLVVAETASGAVVVAAADSYGIVVRTPEGEWLDLGMPGIGGPLVIPTTPKEPYFLVSPFLVGLGVGASVALLALAVAARTRPWTPRRLVPFLGVVPWGVIFILNAIGGNGETAWPDAELLFVRRETLLILALGVLWSLLAAVLARPFAPGMRAKPWLAVAEIGLATGTVAAFMPPSGTGTGIAVLAGGAAVACALIWARRERGRWRAANTGERPAKGDLPRRQGSALAKVGMNFALATAVAAIFLATGLASMAATFAIGLGFGTGEVHGTIEPGYAPAYSDNRHVMSTMTAWDDRLVGCAYPADGEAPVRCDFWWDGYDGWLPLDPHERENYGAEVDLAATTQREACVPSSPDVCFRVVEGALGVERSEDGGESWRIEWEMSVEEAVARLGLRSGDSTTLASMAIAIMEVPVSDGDGYLVGVANGGAGLALRDSASNWNLGLLDDDE